MHRLWRRRFPDLSGFSRSLAHQGPFHTFTYFFQAVSGLRRRKSSRFFVSLIRVHWSSFATYRLFPVAFLTSRADELQSMSPPGPSMAVICAQSFQHTIDFPSILSQKSMRSFAERQRAGRSLKSD
jgi:hypothetical protein